MPAGCRWAVLAAVMCHCQSCLLRTNIKRGAKHLTHCKWAPCRGLNRISTQCVVHTATWRVAALRWFEATAPQEVYVSEGPL